MSHPHVTKVTPESTTRKNAESITKQLVTRRYTEDQREALLVAVLVEQGGMCAMCAGRSPSVDREHLDWSPWERSDDGGPLVRGALCRSCKTALNRYLDESKHRPKPYQVDWLEVYLQRPWRTPEQVLPSIQRATPTPVVTTTEKRAWLDDLIEQNRLRMERERQGG